LSYVSLYEHYHNDDEKYKGEYHMTENIKNKSVDFIHFFNIEAIL